MAKRRSGNNKEPTKKPRGSFSGTTGLFPSSTLKESFRTVPETTITLTQLEELDHLMVNLGYHWKQLVSKFQQLQVVDLGVLEGSDERVLAAKPRIQLAQMLVQAYWHDQLPLVDDLLFTMTNRNPGVPQVRAFELGSAALDNFQSRIVDEARNALQQAQRRAQGSEMTSLQARVQTLGSISSENYDETIPDDNYDISQWPPPLPEIRDPVLRLQTLTHRSYVQDTLATTKKDRQRSDNERLEFKGDAILDFIVAEILYDALPDADEGQLTKAKSSLVCNDTLSEFAHTYELPKKIRAHVDSDILDKNSEKKHKIVADMFEAYIGGVSVDRGYGVVQRWLLRLYEPLLDDLVRARRSAEDIDKNAKTELYKKIGSSTQRIAYEKSQQGDELEVKCVVDGEVLGVGRDKSGKLAGCRAAMDALNHPELIEKFAQRRRNITRTAPITGSGKVI